VWLSVSNIADARECPDAWDFPSGFPAGSWLPGDLHEVLTGSVQRQFSGRRRSGGAWLDVLDEDDVDPLITAGMGLTNE
jgi:hypothetical protein